MGCINPAFGGWLKLLQPEEITVRVYSGFHMCMVQACIAIPASMHFSCEKVTGDLLSTVLSPSFERPLYSCS